MFQSESRTWNIQHLIAKTGHMKEAILLIHAFLGCDSFQNLWYWQRQKSPKLVSICFDVAPIFYNHLFSKLDIQEAGERLLLGLYSRLNIGSLNKV